MNDPARERTALAILGMFIVCFGLLGNGIIAFQAWKGAEVGKWPTVEGIVTNVEVVSRRRRRKSVRGCYEYTVDGRTLTGHFVDSFYTRGEWAQDNPPGTRVAVRYNPEKPSQSRLFYPDELRRDKPTLFMFYLVSTNLGILWGLWMIARAVIQERREKKAAALRDPSASFPA